LWQSQFCRKVYVHRECSFLEITPFPSRLKQLAFDLIAVEKMPVKKRHGVVSAKPGLARVYLQDNFRSFPTSAAEVKNGHVLHIYMTTAGFRGAECERQLKELIRNQLDVSTERSYKADVQRIVSRTVKKYRCLSNPEEFRKFRMECEKSMDLKLTATAAPEHRTGDEPCQTNPTTLRGDEVQPGPSEVVPQPTADGSASPAGDAPTSMGSVPVCSIAAVRSTRSATQQLTPREVKLKKRLEFVTSTCSKQRERIKELRRQLKTPKRVINQALRRKNDTIEKKKRKIQDLKNQLLENHQAIEIGRLKMEIIKMKEAHRKLITYYRNKSKKESASIPIAKYKLLQNKLRERDDAVANLEYENIRLKEQVAELQSRIQELQSPEIRNVISMKTDEKTYSCMTRMMVFDHIVNNVPTANIPALILQSQTRAGVKAEQIPQKTTVELMARELGALSELQAATTILRSDNVTVGFDATTQEGVHVNTIHFTTHQQCCVAALDQLPGGTAADYADHVLDTVDRLSASYSYFTGKDFVQTKEDIIGKIKNSMTDRCAANHAALRIISSNWKKPLNELNCHLHPLDSFASGCRAALKNLQPREGKAYGNECLATNVILQINKLRYKDGKGDPRGFLSFLDKKHLPRCILPRYRGNRLHVLYAISAVLIENYCLFLDFFKTGTSCGDLRKSILQDFTDDVTIMQLRVLGLLGKTLSGPWMRQFYTSAELEINHVEGIRVVRKVLENLKVAAASPECLLTADVDFFGNPLVVDSTMSALRYGVASNNRNYLMMMRSCLIAVVEVIDRQYRTYFSWDLDKKLEEETKSARSHNIDAEEMVGMFSAAKKRSPNATLCYLSCRLRAKKNGTVDFLDNLDPAERELVLQKAISFGRKNR